MTRRTPKAARQPLDEAITHYLLVGCYLHPAGDLELYRLGGSVIRGQLDDLAELWRAHRGAVKAVHRGRTFAEMALAGEQWSRYDGGPFGPCDAHRAGLERPPATGLAVRAPETPPANGHARR